MTGEVRQIAEGILNGELIEDLKYMKNEEIRKKNEGGNSLRGVSVKHNRMFCLLKE